MIDDKRHFILLMVGGLSLALGSMGEAQGTSGQSMNQGPVNQDSGQILQAPPGPAQTVTNTVGLTTNMDVLNDGRSWGMGMW